MHFEIREDRFRAAQDSVAPEDREIPAITTLGSLDADTQVALVSALDVVDDDPTRELFTLVDGPPGAMAPTLTACVAYESDGLGYGIFAGVEFCTWIQWGAHRLRLRTEPGHLGGYDLVDAPQDEPLLGFARLMVRELNYELKSQEAAWASLLTREETK
ncbi:hypothetical protein [Gordonia alkanivorans]|uniref:hypothetical protein n=1 Tax=Gordonia alkanivorans TaxID=84096 RepID=UPI0004B7E5F0|nr:hypothetical protein [Gordonia alkanivorans]